MFCQKVDFNPFYSPYSVFMSLAGELIRRIRNSLKTKRVLFFLAGIIMVPKWSLCDPLVKSYICPYIEMGVARRASSGVRIFFDRPRP